MKLKLDENLGQGALELFKQHGHDTATVAGENLCSAPDRELSAACGRERRRLVTLDLDFGNPLLFRPADDAGIAVLRLPAKPSHRDLLDLAQTLAEALAQRPIEGRLWVVQKGRRVSKWETQRHQLSIYRESQARNSAGALSAS